MENAVIETELLQCLLEIKRKIEITSRLHKCLYFFLLFVIFFFLLLFTLSASVSDLYLVKSP